MPNFSNREAAERTQQLMNEWGVTSPFVIKDQDGKIVSTFTEGSDELKAVMSADKNGNILERNAEGKWEERKPYIDFNKDTGDITIHAPKYITERDNFNDLVGMDNLKQISANYKVDKNFKYPNSNTSSSGETKKIDENTDATELDTAQMIEAMSKGLSDQAPNIKKFADAKKQITEKIIGINEKDLSDNEVAEILNNVAVGDGVNDDTLQALPDFDKINFFGDNKIAEGFKRLQGYSDGYAKRKDILDGPYNREHYADDEIFENENHGNRKSLQYALDKYIEQQRKLINGTEYTEDENGNKVDRSGDIDKKNLAKAVALRMFMEQQTPTTSPARLALDTITSVIDAVGNKLMESSTAIVEVVGSTTINIFNRDAGKAFLKDMKKKYADVERYGANEYEALRHLNSWSGAMWNITSAIAEMSSFALTVLLTGGVGGIVLAAGKAAAKGAAKAAAKGAAKAAAKGAAKAAAKGAAKGVAKSIENVTAKTVLSGARNLIKSVSGTVRNNAISSAIKLSKAAGDIAASDIARNGVKAGANIVSDAIIGATLLEPEAMSEFLAGNASDDEKRALLTQAAWAVGGFGVARFAGKGARALKATTPYKRANMSLSSIISGLEGNISEWKNGTKIIQAATNRLKEIKKGEGKKAVKASEKLQIRNQNQAIAREKIQFRQTVKGLDLSTEEGLAKAFTAKGNLLKLQNATDRMQRGVLATIAEHYNNKKLQKFLTSLDEDLMKTSKEIRKMEKKLGRTGKRLSAGGKGQFSTAGGQVAGKTFSQQTINYIGAKIKAPILKNALRNATRRGDKAAIKGITKEQKECASIIKQFTKENPKELRDLIEKYIATNKQWWHEFENVNHSLGLRTTEDLQRLRQGGITDKDAAAMKKDLMSKGLSEKEADKYIKDLQEGGVFGKNGELYARTQRVGEWTKHLERRQRGEYKRPTVAAEQSYKWGADGDFIDPELVRYDRMVEYAKVYDRNNYARVLINNSTEAKVTATAEQTKATRQINKSKEGKEKAVKQAKKEAIEELVKSNVFEKTLGISKQKELIQDAQKQFDAVKARFQDALKNKVPTDLATRARIISGMDSDIIVQAFKEVYGVNGIKDLIKDQETFEALIVNGFGRNTFEGSIEERVAAMRNKERQPAPEFKTSDGKTVDLDKIITSSNDSYSWNRATQDFWNNMNSEEKGKFAQYLKRTKALDGSKDVNGDTVSAFEKWIKRNRKTVVTRWYNDLKPWIDEIGANIRFVSGELSEAKRASGFHREPPFGGVNLDGFIDEIVIGGKFPHSPAQLMATVVHEVSHQAFARVEFRAPLVEDALKKLGVNAKITEAVANSYDANELVAYMTGHQFLRDFGGKTSKDLLRSPVLAGHLKGVMKLAGLDPNNQELKERLIDLFRAMIRYVEEKISGVNSAKTLDEWYSGIISGQFKKELEVPLSEVYKDRAYVQERVQFYSRSTMDRLDRDVADTIDVNELGSIVPPETKQLIENKIRTYLETAEPDALKSGENILTYENYKRAIEDNNLFDEIDRSFVSNDAKLYETDTIGDAVSKDFLDERIAGLKKELAQATNEYGQVMAKAGVPSAKSSEEAFQMLDENFNNLVNDSLDKITESLLAEGRASRNYFEGICDLAKVADKNLAMTYLAYNSLRQGKKEIIKQLGEKFENQASKGNTESWHNIKSQRKEFEKRLGEAIDSKYEQLRVALGHNSPLVDSKKWFRDVYKKMHEIENAVDSTNKSVTVLDDNGHAVVYETDPLVSDLANYKPATTELPWWQKINYVWSKVFRLGTTGIRLTSIVNQTFRDSINAWLGGGIFNTVRKCAKDMEEIFGRDPMKFLAQYKDYEQVAIKTAAKESGVSLEKSMAAYEVSRGRAISPAATETQSTRLNKDRMAKNTADKIMNTIDNVSEDIQVLNNVREKYLRNRTYSNAMRDALAEGHSVEYARAVAEFVQSNATTNFSRAMVHLRAFQQTVPYLGAAVNGTKSFYRLFEMDPVGVMGRFMGGLVIPTIALTAMSLSSEENKKVWKDLPEYMKKDALPFVIDGQVFTIPLPQEISSVVAPFRQFVESLYGANRHAFWELAINDVVGISPIDFSGFTNLDNSNLYENNNLMLGVTRLASQLMPPPVKTAVMAKTGTDPYTGRKIYKSRVWADPDTGEEQIMDDKTSAFSKLLSNIFGGENGLMSAQAAALIVPGLVGKGGLDILDTLTKLGQAVIPGGEEGSLTYGVDRTLGSISDALTYTQKKPSAEYAWQNTINELYKIKDSILSPQTQDGQYFQSMITNIRNAQGDPEKQNALIEKKNAWLDEKFYGKAKTMVENLMNQYGNEAFDKRKYAAVISLFTMSETADVNDARQQLINTDQWQNTKNNAIATMERLGFPVSQDFGIFGYQKMDSTGKIKTYYATPMAILNTTNAIKGASSLHSANLESILYSSGIKSKIDAIKAQREVLYSNTKKNKNAIDASILNQNALVMEALEPYVRKYGVNSLLSNQALYTVLYQYMDVPMSYESKVYNKNANKKAGFIKNYVKQAFSKYIEE